MPIFTNPIAWATITLFLAVFIVRVINRKRAYEAARIQNGCSLPRKYPHNDPLLGIDMFIDFAKAMKSGTVISTVDSYFPKYGKTFQSNSFGTTVINTTDPKVIQYVLAVGFDKFGVEATRKVVLEPIMKDGVFVSDGQEWVHARASVKQIFSGVRNSSVESIEKHVERLLALIPRDGSTIDLQPLLKRLVFLPYPKLQNLELIGKTSF